MLALTACVGAPESGDVGADETDVQPIKAAHATFENVGQVTPVDQNQSADLDQFGLLSREGPNNQAPAGGGQSLTQAGIQYHNGPVMTSPITIYPIWYGTQWTAADKTLITSFITGLGASTWWTGIETTYTSSGGTPVSTSVSLGAQYTYPSPKTSLTDNGVFSAVKNSIGAGKLPSNANGIYVLLTSKEVHESSGFCTQYCGWHTNGTSGIDIKYSFVGNAATQCPSGCSAQSGGPNGNPGVDGLVSVLAHEIAEAASDPDLNAWWETSSGMENADKCAWTFGSMSGSSPNQYNMSFGGHNWLVQRNWKNSGSGACAMQ
jgi:hypothetical protein